MRRTVDISTNLIKGGHGLAWFLLLCVTVYSPWLAPAIACLVFALQEKDADFVSACSDNYDTWLNEYIKSSTSSFLECAGALQIALILFTMTYTFLFAMCGRDYHSSKMPKCLFFFMTILILFLAAMGMEIYSNQMSSECQKTGPAKMMLAWGIIQYILVCIGPCLMCFGYWCIEFADFYISDAAVYGGLSVSDPLESDVEAGLDYSVNAYE